HEHHQAIETTVARELGLSFGRYGLRFAKVEAVSIRHPQFDEHRKHMGEAWLLREGQSVAQDLDQLYTADQRRRLEREEAENQILLLADNIANDQLEGKVRIARRRLDILRNMESAVKSDKLAELRDATDFRRATL